MRRSSRMLMVGECLVAIVVVGLLAYGIFGRSLFARLTSPAKGPGSEAIVHVGLVTMSQGAQTVLVPCPDGGLMVYAINPSGGIALACTKLAIKSPEAPQ